MKSFIIGKNDADQRLDKYITKTLPGLPQSLLYKYLRTKRIKLNGKKADIAARLKEGDAVDMYINDEFFAPDEGEYVDTLITRVQRYLYEKGEYDPKNEASFAPALANRIDRNTGGIVLAAKNAESLRILNEKIKAREIEKQYLCVTVGRPPKKADTVEGFLVKNEKTNTVTVLDHPVPGGKSIRTSYRVLRTNGDLALAEVTLHTGRTHQIRAQMAALGCPLLGDGKYGTNALNKRYGGYKKQCRYSYKTTFAFTTDAGLLNYLKGQTVEVTDVWFAKEFETLTNPSRR